MVAWVRLCAVSTVREKRRERAWTHQLWYAWLRRQIDFVLIDDIRIDDVIGSDIIADLDGKSDHRGVAADIQILEWRPQRQRRMWNQKGWKAHLNDKGHPTAYYDALGMALASFQNAGVDPADQVVKAWSSTGCARSSYKSQHTAEVR